ncbi:hypothetical protein BGW37DRAFT_15055 [Umbelopsis sp. PMI_123]|nr:hypothetical protein BGW37DRAFT_15055 [Umbelopsis sp. PMI_123]
MAIFVFRWIDRQIHNILMRVLLCVAPPSGAKSLVCKISFTLHKYRVLMSGGYLNLHDIHFIIIIILCSTDTDS